MVMLRASFNGYMYLEFNISCQNAFAAAAACHNMLLPPLRKCIGTETSYHQICIQCRKL